MGINNKITIAVSSVMPDGNGSWQPVPEVMTPDEAVLYLRLNESGCKNPLKTLKYYSHRDRGLLKPTRIGRRVYYTRKELNRFLEQVTN
jgi:hypothetical protein